VNTSRSRRGSEPGSGILVTLHPARLKVSFTNVLRLRIDRILGGRLKSLRRDLFDGGVGSAVRERETTSRELPFGVPRTELGE
jgi:hypothetical protein